jgi:hypothetical protein
VIDAVDRIWPPGEAANVTGTPMTGVRFHPATVPAGSGRAALRELPSASPCDFTSCSRDQRFDRVGAIGYRSGLRVDRVNRERLAGAASGT